MMDRLGLNLPDGDSDDQQPSVRPSAALRSMRGAVREVAAKFPVSNLRIFGSVLHGTDKEGSDVDLLVDAQPGATLFDLGGLQEELQTLLGVRVDLLTPADIPVKWRAKIVSEAEPI